MWFLKCTGGVWHRPRWTPITTPPKMRWSCQPASSRLHFTAAHGQSKILKCTLVTTQASLTVTCSILTHMHTILTAITLITNVHFYHSQALTSPMCTFIILKRSHHQRELLSFSSPTCTSITLKRSHHQRALLSLSCTHITNVHFYHSQALT